MQPPKVGVGAPLRVRGNAGFDKFLLGVESRGPGDGSPPVGSMDKAPVGSLGDSSPRSEAF